MTTLSPRKNLNATLYGDFEFEKTCETSYYKVKYEGNRRGMTHDDIPNILGLREKMALRWSKTSIGLPIDILSTFKNRDYLSFCKLGINIHGNILHIHVHGKHYKRDKWNRAEIQVTIEG